MPTEGRSPRQLIASKTRAPAVRGEFIERTRLLGPLLNGAGPIVVIEAPAGYGKFRVDYHLWLDGLDGSSVA